MGMLKSAAKSVAKAAKKKVASKKKSLGKPQYR
jgi:hypothetical protein